MEAVEQVEELITMIVNGNDRKRKKSVCETIKKRTV